MDKWNLLHEFYGTGTEIQTWDFTCDIIDYGTNL